MIEKNISKTGCVKMIRGYWSVVMIFTLLSGYALSQVPQAPKRPTCTSIEKLALGSCGFTEENGIGEGVRVLLFDPGGGHSSSKRYLREALTRLSDQYGFQLDRRQNVNDLDSTDLIDTKLIIYSSTEGDIANNIPNANVRRLIENFIMQNGWGILMVHEACSFIDSWEFLQDVCIHQYFHYATPSYTSMDVYLENRRVDGVGHGLTNPYTNFLLRKLPERVNMRDEYITWRGAPRTTHQYNRESKNKIMILGLDESSRSTISNPKWGEDHSVVWAHTMGPADGIAINYTLGHDDVFSQSTYGDTLLWRLIRYAAKDWESKDPTKIQQIDYSAGLNYSIQQLPPNSKELLIRFLDSELRRVSIIDISGKKVFDKEWFGMDLEVSDLKRGVYLLSISHNGKKYIRKISVY